MQKSWLLWLFFLIIWGCSSLHQRTSCSMAPELRKLHFLQLGPLNGSIQHRSMDCECFLPDCPECWECKISCKCLFFSGSTYFAYLFKLIILLVCFSETSNPLLNKMDRQISKKPNHPCFPKGTNLTNSCTVLKVIGNVKTSYPDKSCNRQCHKMDSRVR